MKLFVVLFGSSKFYSSMMFLLTNLVRRIRWKQFFKHFLDAVGTLSAFATLIAFVGPWKSPEYSSFGCLILIGIIVLISLTYTYFQIQTIRSLTILMRPQLQVTVKEGDVLKHDIMLDTVAFDKTPAGKEIGSIQNRFPVNSSIVGMTTFIDTIKSVKLRITNPIEGATIKIYGVRA